MTNTAINNIDPNLQNSQQDNQQVQNQINDSGFQIPEEVHTFLEGILQEANITTIDDDIRERMIQELFVRLDKFLITKVIQYLPEDKLDEFMEMDKKQESLEKSYEWLQANIPNLEEVFGTAFAEFREMYLEGVDIARNQEETPEEQEQVNAPQEVLDANKLEDIASQANN